MRWLTRSLIIGLALISTTPGLTAGPPEAPLPAGRIDRAGLARGPFSHMHMKLEWNVLGVDVVAVDLWLDEQTRDRLRGLAEGRSYSAALAGQLASAVIKADGALVQMVFLRDVSLDQFYDSLRQNLGRARDAGLISRATFDTSWARVRAASEPLSRRGLKDGDRLLYRARPSSLHTMLVTKDGQVLVDVTTKDPTARRTLLASYFAPGSDFREPLLRDLFR